MGCKAEGNGHWKWYPANPHVLSLAFCLAVSKAFLSERALFGVNSFETEKLELLSGALGRPGVFLQGNGNNGKKFIVAVAGATNKDRPLSWSLCF